MRYGNDIFLSEHWEKLTGELNMDEQRVALILKSGTTYFVADILEEWGNAIRFMPEGVSMQPVLVFKSCIEAIKVMDRAQPRNKKPVDYG